MICVDECYNMDCADGMREMIEQGMRADWLITDPPYGIGIEKMSFTQSGAKKIGKATRRDYTNTGKWDSERIDKEYFDLMFKVSKNQIIFGGNYYTDILPPTKSWIVWDKRCDDKLRNDFADCELAWASGGGARVFHYLYNGMIQGDMKNKDVRFHPTQKPTRLWEKILNFYTRENDLILDPFAGSQSLRVACYKTGRHYIGFEIDKYYYEEGCRWYNDVTSQMSIFDFEQEG